MSVFAKDFNPKPAVEALDAAGRRGYLLSMSPLTPSFSPVRSAALIGLGAVGTLLCAKVAAAGSGGRSAWRIIADADRIQRFRKEPPRFNGQPLAPDFADPARGGPPADLILVAVKARDLPRAMDNLRPFVGPNTQILPLLNGLEAHDLLVTAFGAEHVLHGLLFCNSAMRDGTAVVQHGTVAIQFGEMQNPPPFSERVRAVLDWFTRQDIPATVPPDMRTALWRKFLLNVGLNQAEAVFHLTHGELLANATAMQFARDLMSEAAACAAAEGVPGADTLLEEAMVGFSALAPGGKSSMLQDVEAGRPPETDWFAGTVLRLAQRHGLPASANARAATALTPPV